ncbi:MAG: N-acetylmuramoyl-L-alanine amidase [Peptococcaceae bacterium]|jgi:N-acetylmuramoyl-L-alanine amidase|nr:N-acetylmuramoyl-L-alanine amidase [Peptococcaceae bacterium]
MRVCLDPGHNQTGADAGARGNGLKEEVLTLSIARRVQRLLIDGNVEVVMTRSGMSVPVNDTVYHSLKYRVDLANQAKADLFVSIHINAHDQQASQGAEILLIAEGGEDERCANLILPKLAEAGGFINRGLKTADLQVLRDTAMPALLTVSGFITNPEDAAKLKDDLYIQRIAIAHAQGICAWGGIRYAQEHLSGENITPLHGGIGWIERLPDRVSIHIMTL